MFARFLAVIALLIGVRAFGDVYSYECDVPPIAAGWTLIQTFCDPEEWVDEGWLFHHVQLCEGYDPPVGSQVYYMRSLAEFINTEEYFVHWRVETDGPSSEIPAVAPAGLVTSNGGGVSYHFTIARDQVRVIFDCPDWVLWIDIEPDVPHSYRLEVYWDEFYVLYVDGELIDSGVPAGAHPAFNPQINIGVTCHLAESTTRWDYIRYGRIPVDGSGDYDSSEGVNPFDYYFVHECLLGPDSNAGPGCRFADFDFDADVDLADFAAFQNAFTGAP